MRILAAIAAGLMILAVLLDAFETVILPRRVKRTFRLTAVFYRNTWRPWRWISQQISNSSRRDSFLAYFGPLSLLMLLLLWAACIIFSFALLQYAIGQHLRLGNEHVGFGVLLYHSGETFLTLGYGDITPTNSWARMLSVMEAGTGFALLGVVIGYLPTIYSAFSKREIEISLLDARAGSPPSAAELLIRFGCCPDQEVLDAILRDWERWAAETLESHLSYPVLSFYRSQHFNQSWLGALATILDTTALLTVGVNNLHSDQAKLTFAMARHAVVDLAQVVTARYDPNAAERLTATTMKALRRKLADNGLRLQDGPASEEKLTELRALYEPYLHALSTRLSLRLPEWVRTEAKKDNWQGGPWDRLIQSRGLARPRPAEDHF